MISIFFDNTRDGVERKAALRCTVRDTGSKREREKRKKERKKESDACENLWVH
jgi:hypothetical protein